MEEVLSFLESLEDDRQQWKIVHSLKDIVVIVLFGTLADCDQWVEIGEWAKYHQGLLKKVIELAHGIPSHDTIQRVMASIKPETFKRLSDMAGDGKGSGVSLVIGLDVVYYLVMCMTNYVEYAEKRVNSWAFGAGEFAAIALVLILHILINRSALYSWLLFIVLSLLGLGALLYDAPPTILSGSFAYGLGEGLGYIIIFYICGGAIKRSRSLKMFRLYCLMFFIEYFVISGILTKCNDLFSGQSHILTFGMVFILCCVCFLLTPLLQKKVFDAPWTDGLYLTDMVEYAPVLAEAEKVDTEKHLGLSPRETEVFTLLLTEAPAKQIAHTLKISYSGVNFHTKNLYRKLGIQSRTELFAKFGKK
ncbi:hypothetical protein AGMMS49928_09250 [Spirochaetia bacterium]|nr:hypothetical protein AGMMS49928_09250 [Spirochaetia bacterium]